jgi:hypothetical protein
MEDCEWLTLGRFSKLAGLGALADGEFICSPTGKFFQDLLVIMLLFRHDRFK